ncbi:MAG: hypothetical protein ACRDRW_16700 [Pseudonocardiaceae bacterium]
MDAIDRSAALGTFDQAWSARSLQVAGEHAAATEMAERALRSPHGSSGSDDFLNAGVEQWAAERIRELLDDTVTAPLRVQRLRQMLAWLTAAPGQQ